MPLERDFKFYQRRKHDKWREAPAPAPALEWAVADSHAHIHMLPDPAWELARCAANGVDFVCMIVDPSEDGSRPFDELAAWQAQSGNNLADALENQPNLGFFSSCACLQDGLTPAGMHAEEMRPGVLRSESSSQAVEDSNDDVCDMHNSKKILKSCDFETPAVRIACGVHPHNAKLYDDGIEVELIERLADPRIGALGEIGLDYHYDLSPRDAQRRVFCRQIEIAKELELPIALHLRGGEDPQADNAHAEAFAILYEMDALGPRTLLHCCALPPDELRPWIEADCFVAYGGALTFKNADAAREGAKLVPTNRLMLETDSPYMTPEPMRGATCTPAHVVFTAACLAETRGIASGEERRAFLQQLHDNTVGFYTRDKEGALSTHRGEGEGA